MLKSQRLASCYSSKSKVTVHTFAALSGGLSPQTPRWWRQFVDSTPDRFLNDGRLLLVDNSALHHKTNVLQHSDILQRIPRHRDHIR